MDLDPLCLEDAKCEPRQLVDGLGHVAQERLDRWVPVMRVVAAWCTDRTSRARGHARTDCPARKNRMSTTLSSEVTMTNAKKMPRPIRISRKLTLSSEKLVLMRG